MGGQGDHRVSSATKCDACGEFFEPPVCGALTIEGLHLDTGNEKGTHDTWAEIDLCVGCARPLLKLLKPALADLDDKYTEGG